MIIETAELPRLRGQVTMVDGGFDPIHAGHVAYFRAASELGLPVFCNVSGDSWVSRKHRPLLPHTERAEVIDAIRFVDWTHCSTLPTVDVLVAARPRFYAKGADWRDRLPAAEKETCEELGIEVVFLDTVRNSSTEILRRYDEARV
jgi:bifunctional ADP-heptose synthase (sugar kinase/adenylyltransferase)